MPRLSRLELLVHGLAQGVGVFLFVSSLFALLQEPEPYWLFQPGARGLRNLEIALSAVVALLGMLGVAATLAFDVRPILALGPPRGARSRPGLADARQVWPAVCPLRRTTGEGSPIIRWSWPTIG